MSENTLDFFVDGMFRCSLRTNKHNVIGEVENMIDSDSIIDIKLSTDKVQVRTNTHIKEETYDGDHMWDEVIDDEATVS